MFRAAVFHCIAPCVALLYLCNYIESIANKIKKIF